MDNDGRGMIGYGQEGINVRGKRNSFIFRRFYLTNLILIMIPLIVLFIYSMEYFGTTRAERVASVTRQAAQLLTQIELKLEKIDNFNDGFVYNNETISQALQDVKAGYTDADALLKLWNASSSAAPFFSSLSDTLSVAIIQPDNEVVIGNQSTSTGLYTFYRALIRFDGMGYEAWYDRHFAAPRRSGFVEEMINASHANTTRQSRALCYRVYRRDAVHDRGDYYLMAWYSLDNFLPQMQYEAMDGERVFLRDAQGMIVAELSERGWEMDMLDIPTDTTVLEARLDGVDALVLNHVSASHGITLTNVLDKAVLFAELNAKQPLFYGIELLVLALGLVISGLIAKRNAAPIETFTTVTLKPHSASLDSKGYYTTMMSIFDAIRSTQESQRTHIIHQEQMTHRLLLERMLEYPYQEEHLAEAAMRAGLDLEADGYAVLIVQSGAQDAQETPQGQLVRGGVQDLVQAVLADRGFCYLSEDGNSIVLLKLAREAGPDAFAQELDAALSRITPAQHRIAVSGISGAVPDLSALFMQAQAALAGTWTEGSTIVYAKDEDKQSIHFVYPRALEAALSNNLKLGNVEAVVGVLREIDALNFGQVPISSASSMLLFSEIIGTLYRTVNELANPVVSRKALVLLGELRLYPLSREGSLAESGVFSVCLSICEQIMGERRREANQSRQALVTYIHEHYGNSGLCIEVVQDFLGVSSTTATQWSKEMLGDTFSVYLEKLRLEKAMELMRQPQLTIVEISERVGYASYTSFSRAFKRRNGISPARYREIHGQE